MARVKPLSYKLKNWQYHYIMYEINLTRASLLFVNVIPLENSKKFGWKVNFWGMAPQDGLEPPTQWLTATCSTN